MISLPEFTRMLLKSLRDFQMYGAEHPNWERSLGRLSEAYAGYLGNRAKVQLATRNGRIFVDKVPEDLQNLQVKALAGLFEDRQIHAIVFMAGAMDAELQHLCALLSLKPAQIREAGGPKAYLDERQVTHVQVLATRLEEVTEAGEVLASLLETAIPLGPLEGGHGAAGEGSGALPPAVPPSGDSGMAEEGGVVELATRMRHYLLSLASGSGSPADLGTLGGMLHGAGFARDGSDAAAQGAISQAIAGLEPEQRMALLRGAGTLGAEPLRRLFGKLVGNQGVDSLVELYRRGALTDEELGEAASDLQRASPNPSQWTNHLVEALRREGLTDKQLEDLVDVLTWDSLSLEDRMAKVLEGQRIFEIPAAKVLSLLRELLESGRTGDFLQVLDHYAAGLAFPAVARRAGVAKAFESIADWVDIPGMPGPVMKELLDHLARAYGREKDPDVHRWFSLAVEHLLWFWVEEGSPQRAEGMFADLQDVVTELSLPAPWKERATQDLLARLGTPERIDKVLKQLFYLDREAAAIQVHPYLRMLGAQAAAQLVERLGEEQDRVRRGRLLEALKSCGSVAEAPMLEALQSPEWFVVRNALIVLGEVASPERLPEVQAALNHPDARVVRAAVRAAARVGGRQAEGPLVALLPHTDPATQLEVLFALAEIKAKGAVPALAELAKGRGKLKAAPEKVREKAVETLGLLGSPTAIPALEALLVRRKGFFSEQREPAAVRIAAFRALLALGSPEALQAADRALGQEPEGDEKTAFLGAMYPR